jgi:hypothetical protein
VAIALRGISQVGGVSNGADVTLTFDTITPPQTDDIVVVYGGHGTATTTLAAPGTGYTQVAIHTGTAPIFGVWYKRMGATPDTSVVCSGGGNALDAVAYACQTFSGVDTTTALDQTTTTAGPTTSTNPNAPSITTQTANALVIALAGSNNRDTTPGTVSGYSNQQNTNRNDTNDITIASATFLNVGADAEDPPAWSSWASGTWYAVTMALKEGTTATEVDPNKATQTLNTYSPTIATGINATTAALSLAVFAATVTTDVNLNPNTASLSLTTNQASVGLGYTGNVASLNLNTQAAGVVSGTSIDPNTASLSLNTHSPTVKVSTSVDATTASLSLLSHSPTVKLDTEIAPNVAALSLAVYQANVNAQTAVDASTATLSLATQAPTVQLATDVDATTATLSLTTQSPTVQLATEITPNTATLSLNSYVAAIQADTNVDAGSDPSGHQCRCRQGNDQSVDARGVTINQYRCYDRKP